VNRLDPALRRIPHRFVAGLIRSAKAGGAGSGERLRGHGLRLIRRGERLFLERDIVGLTEKGYFIAEKLACTVLVPEAGLLVRVRERDDERDGVSGPLIFRSARSDDCIRIRDGYKPIRKLFSEWKIPCSERWKVPIVVDRRGVLAVLGGPLGHRNRFRHALPEPMRRRLSEAVKVSVAEEQ
jgi:tRNA(Ile)-lysidine synthetase-like protein